MHEKFEVTLDEARSDGISHGMQHTVVSLLANVYEPLLNRQIQRFYANQKYDNTLKSGSYLQNLAGELIGDVTGMATILAAETFIPRTLHTATTALRHRLDPYYITLAQRKYADEKDMPGYKDKVEKWADYQERNLVRSIVATGANVIGNVIGQKYLLKPLTGGHMNNNASHAGVIFAGKLSTSLFTTSLHFGARSAYPEKMKKVDDWLANNIGDRLISGVNKINGDGRGNDKDNSTYTGRLLGGSVDNPLLPVR